MSPRVECIPWGVALVIAGCGARPSPRDTRCVTATFVWPFSFESPGPARIAYAIVDVPLGDPAELFNGHIGAHDRDGCQVLVSYEAEGNRFPYSPTSVAHTFDWNDPCAQVVRERYDMRWDDLPLTEVYRRSTQDSVLALCADGHEPPAPWISGGARWQSDSIGCIAGFFGPWIKPGDKPPHRNYAEAVRLCSTVHIITEVPEYRQPLPDLNGSGAMDVKATAEPTGR